MLKKLGNFFYKKQILRSFCQRQSFSEIPNIQQKTVDILNDHGYSHMTNIQQATFQKIFERQNVIARDKTGQGKTLAFALPLVERLRQEQKFQKTRTPLVLVITPTRELAIQVFKQFNKLKNHPQEFVCSVVFGGTGRRFVEQQLEQKVDIVIGTPGKLIEQIEKKKLYFEDLQALVLDETDNMLNMGFEQDINSIFSKIKQQNLNEVQCVLFSATIPNWVKQISQKSFDRQFELVNMVKDKDDDIPKNIKNYLCQVQDNSQKDQILVDLVLNQLKKKIDSKILIFTNKKSSVQNIAASSYFLSKISATFSGQQSQSHRQFFLQGFRQGVFKCLICTDVASRGLDIDNVDLVIQYDLQQDTEQFIHRAGRVGRMNKEGSNVFFVAHQDYSLLNKIKNKYKFKYFDFDDYVANNFLEEMIDHNLDAPLEDISDDSEINIRIKCKDNNKSKEEKQKFVEEFRNSLQENSDIAINKRNYIEDLQNQDPLKQQQNTYSTVIKRDFFQLKDLAKEYDKSLFVYPQSQMYTEVKKILIQVDVGDIDISDFFQVNQVKIKSYNETFSTELIEQYCQKLLKSELISEIPIIREQRSAIQIHKLYFQDKKNVCRFLQETSSSKIENHRVDISLEFKNINENNRRNSNDIQKSRKQYRRNDKNFQRNAQIQFDQNI